MSEHQATRRWANNMLGTTIKLARRNMRSNNNNNNNHQHSDQIASVECTRRKCMLLEPDNGLLKSDYYHCYSFRWDKQLTKEPDDNLCLSVTNVTLPPNISTFNTGSSISKWSTKKPRLKSSNNRPRKRLSKLEDTLCNLPQIESHELTIPINQIAEEENEDVESILEDEESMDEDVRRLCLSLSDSTVSEEIDGRRKKKSGYKERKCKTGTQNGDNKKDRRVNRKSRVKSKTISFSLSTKGDTSPETEQVIRVDVISNYSYKIDSRPESALNYQSICDICNGHCGNECENCVTPESHLQCHKIELNNRDIQ